MTPLLEATLSSFNTAAVRWCLLRGVERLSNQPGDVDMLIHPSDVPIAGTLLRELGFVRIPSWGRGSHQFHVGYDKLTDTWVKLDIMTQIAFGHDQAMKLACAVACIDRRVQSSDVFVVHPADGFWLLLLHCLLDKGSLRDDDKRSLSDLVRATESDSPVSRELVDKRITIDPAHVIELVKNRDWERLLAHGSHLERTWRHDHSNASRWTAIKNRVLLRSTKLLNLTRRRGMSVALLGPDGAGKSTVAAAVARDFLFPTRTVYMGLYQAGSSFPPAFTTHVPGLPFALRMLSLRVRWTIGLYHRLRGRMVVFDRYAFDGLRDSGDVGFKRRLRKGIVARSCPAPDLTFILDAPGTVLFSRKGEHSPELLEAERQQLARLARLLDHAEVVDATDDIEQVKREVVARIWRQYALRWK